MPTRLLCIVALCVGLMTAPVGAVCVTGIPLDSHFDWTTMVFVGRAVNQQADTEVLPNGGRRFGNTETTFEVETIWKGPINTKQLRVVACGVADARGYMSCTESFNFVVGSRYLVFAWRKAPDAPLTANGCSPTAAVDQAGETLKWLSAKPSTSPR